MIQSSFDLDRFVEAQASIYAQVRGELAAGRKQSHWMWFIFPQIHGLGSSPTARRFAITGIDEAIAYLDHPVLGARLYECAELVYAVMGRSASEIFGYPDDLKFHSSATLFAEAARRAPAANSDNQIFGNLLTKYFDGNPDRATLDRLSPSTLLSLGAGSVFEGGAGWVRDDSHFDVDRSHHGADCRALSGKPCRAQETAGSGEHDGVGRAEAVSERPGEQAAEGRHSDERNRVVAHHAAAHFLGDEGLDDGVAGGEALHHSEAYEEHEEK
jgi:uncharacterized protein (DUF1810 family)